MSIFSKVKIDQDIPGTTNGVSINSPIPTGTNTIGVVEAKLIDENGVTYGVPHIENKPRVVATPYLYDIAEGLIPGHYEFERFSYNPDIDINSEDLWPTGGAYVFPSAAMGMEILSDSTEDDPAKPGAGTGIHTVTLYYLTSDGTEKTEDINLDGTTVVPTVGLDIYRVQSLRAKTVGTSGAAVGTITLRHLTNTPIYTTIEPGNTRSRNSAYTVPNGYALFITSMFVGCSSTAANNGALVTVRATYDHLTGSTRTFFMPHAEAMVGSAGGGTYRPFELPLMFPALTDIKASATSLANNCAVSLALRGWKETV